MDENKKKFIVIGIAVLAIIAAAMMFSKSGIAGPKEEVVGSLEGGVNKDTGLPLNPPPASGAPAEDPSLK